MSTLYFTNLRIIWDEYVSFQPVAWCECGGCRCDSARRWHDYQQCDFTAQFLIGLNESYAQLRSQMMQLDHLPPIAKAFALAIQEERQRAIGSSLSTMTSPMLVNVSESTGILTNASQASSYCGGKDKLLCTHCGRTNHTIDKCFQLHGYPPGFGRGRGRSGGGFNSQSSKQSSVKFAATNDGDSSLVERPPTQLSYEYCQQLMSLLQAQMQSQSGTKQDASNGVEQNTSDIMNSPFSGCFHGEEDWDG